MDEYDSISKRQETADSILLRKPPVVPSRIELTEEELKGFVKKKPKPLNPSPFIKFYDPNNQNEQDILDGNPRLSAVLVGSKWSF